MDGAYKEEYTQALPEELQGFYDDEVLAKIFSLSIA